MCVLWVERVVWGSWVFNELNELNGYNGVAVTNTLSKNI